MDVPVQQPVSAFRQWASSSELSGCLFDVSVAIGVIADEMLRCKLTTKIASQAQGANVKSTSHILRQPSQKLISRYAARPTCSSHEPVPLVRSQMKVRRQEYSRPGMRTHFADVSASLAAAFALATISDSFQPPPNDLMS